MPSPKPATRAKKAPQTRKTVGRPLKLTPELRAEFVNILRTGVPLKTALGYVGLSDEAIYTWRNAAEKAKKKPESQRTQGERDMIAFFGEADRALHEATVRAQGTVTYLFSRPLTQLTPEEKRIALQAAQFHLTHRQPRDYSMRTATEISGPDGGPIQISGAEALELLRQAAPEVVDDGE